MKGNRKKVDTDCTYDLVLTRFHHETVSDLGKRQAEKFKRTVGINNKVLQMIYNGYQIPSTLK